VTTEPLQDDGIGRPPSGTEVALVDALRDAAADSIRADAYERKLLAMKFHPQGLRDMVIAERKRIIGK
jgi:hypothetical protein